LISLDNKFANSVIRFLYEADKPVIKSALSKVVNNPYTLSKLLESLSKEGLINYSINEFGRKSYNISLTQKGRDVAEHLMKLDAISKGKKLPSTERYAVILYLYRNGSKNMKEIKDDLPGSADIIRDLMNLKVVKQEIDSSSYPQKTKLELTEKGERIGSLIEKAEKEMEEEK